MKTFIATVLLVLALSGCTTATQSHAAPAPPMSTPTTPTASTPETSARTPDPVDPAASRQVFDVSLPQGKGRMLGTREVAMGTDVPWEKVGRGWRLTMLDQGKQHAEVFRISAQLLDLISPTGGRYQLLKSPTRGRQPWQLADWSRDGRTALLTRSGRGVWSSVVAVDLRTGEQRTMRIPRAYAALLRADGGGLWVTNGNHGARAIDWDGTVTAYPVGSTLLQAPDGRVLASGRRTMTLLAPDGDRRTVRAPGNLCNAVRWWRPGVVLTECATHGGIIRLAAVPLDGSRPTWVSKPHGKDSPDLGDFNAYRLDGTTFLQASGACGYSFLGRQHDDGSVTNVDPPDAVGNVTMQGVQGHRLLVTHEMSCEPPAPPVQVLAAYDPVTRGERVLAQLPAGEQFGRILAYDTPTAVGW